MLNYRIVGSNIRYARIQRKITQEEIAERMEITPNYYGRYERGDIRPNLDRLMQISEILSTPIENFFAGAYDPKNFEQPTVPDTTANGIARLISGCSEKSKAVMRQFIFQKKFVMRSRIWYTIFIEYCGDRRNANEMEAVVNGEIQE